MEKNPLNNKITLTIPEACAMAGCQRSTLYREAHKGNIKIRKMGRKSFLLADDVLEWVTNLPVAEFGDNP